MARRQSPNERVDGEELFEPSREEVNAHRDAVKSFEQKRINGKLASRFEQYAASQGAITFSEFGEVVVHNPSKWSELLKVQNKAERQAWGEQERIFEAFPEERKKHQQEISTLMHSLGIKFKLK